MKITTQKQVNVLAWSIGLMLWGCLLMDFLTDFEIMSAITGLVLIGSSCLFYVVHQSEPGQQLFSHTPQKLLPENKLLRWTLLLAGGIATVSWVLDIGKFLLAR